MGVAEVFLMPESAGIGRLALDRLKVSLKASTLDMRLENTQDDSTRAAAMMREMGTACIITLGGDGTNRVVSKGCGDTPLLSVATGTNNAAPDPTTDDEGDFVTDWAGGGASIYPAEVLTTEDTPDAGALSVALVGAVDGPTTATVYRCELYVSDEFGDLVTRLSVPVATGRTAGDAVEIPAPNELVHDDGPATAYAMAVPLDALPDQTTAPAALAAVRLAQSSGEDGAPLRVVAAEVPGLVGPDTRVSFDGAGRFTEAMPASFAGGALDFRTGMTRGTWTEVRTDGYPE
jgi:hypothetical protein